MRRRILLSMVAVAALAVGLFGVPLGLAVGQLYRSQELTRLQRAATSALPAVPAGGIDSGDPIELPRNGEGIRVALYNGALHRVAGRAPASGGPLVRRALRGHASQGSEGDLLVAAVPIVDDERVVGAAWAAAPLGRVVARTHRTWLVMTGLGALAVIAAAVVARRQARRLSTPVAALASTAARVGEGDFGARAARSGIPELDDAAAALDVTAARVGDLVERERAFSADASHQLRTPLTALRLTLEAALANPHADLRLAISQAVDEVDRLQATTEELLAVARDAPRARGPVDIEALVQEVQSRWHGTLAAAGRPLRTSLDSNLPAVVASTHALRHVLEVLVDNAVVHGAGAVSVRARRTPGGLAVEVSDEGAGINGDVATVFMRRSPSEHGHGIGLALARSLAEAEGGEVVVERAGPKPVFALILTGMPRLGEPLATSQTGPRR